MENGSFKCNKTELKNVSKEPNRRVIYSPALFGFKNVQGDGKYVRVAILDSGLPVHKNILTDEFKSKNFTQSKSVLDSLGHSTAIAGIIAANGENGIQGFAPKTDLFFGKVLLDSNGYGNHESVIESILWSITREVDIIVMSFGSSEDHPGLRDCIRKAHKLGISMFAACGNCTVRTKDASFPARYDEVFSVGYSNTISTNEVIKHSGKTKGIITPSCDFETTFLDSKFVTMSGSSLCNAVVAGVSVLVYQNMRHKGLGIKDSQNIYNEVGSLAIKD